MKTRTILLAGLTLSLSGCLNPPPAPNALDSSIAAEANRTGERKGEPRPRGVEEALLPPLRMEMPSVA